MQRVAHCWPPHSQRQSAPPAVGAQTSSAPGPSATAAPTTVSSWQRRTIEVNGKPASSVRHSPPDGPPALLPEVGKPFASGSRNHIDQRA